MNGFQWWMLMPFVAMGFGFFGMWLRYKHRSAELSLLQTYVSQGKEPPPTLLEAIKNSKVSQPQGIRCAWRRVTTFGSLSVGFSAAYLAMVPDVMSARRAHPFLVVAIIMGALTLGALVNVLIQRKYESK